MVRWQEHQNTASTCCSSSKRQSPLVLPDHRASFRVLTADFSVHHGHHLSLIFLPFTPLILPLMPINSKCLWNCTLGWLPFHELDFLHVHPAGARLLQPGTSGALFAHQRQGRELSNGSPRTARSTEPPGTGSQVPQGLQADAPADGLAASPIPSAAPTAWAAQQEPPQQSQNPPRSTWAALLGSGINESASAPSANVAPKLRPPPVQLSPEEELRRQAHLSRIDPATGKLHCQACRKVWHLAVAPVASFYPKSLAHCGPLAG